MDKLLTISLKITKEDRTYILSVPYGAPYGETYDVLYEMLNEIAKMIQERIEQDKQGGEHDAVKQ